jgi:hypothetical protein
MELVIAQNKEDLEHLEDIIGKGQLTFYEVGRALMEIRHRELYRDVLGYETFEAYCKERWDFKRTYAFYLIESAKVIDNVHNCEQKPATESQARPLTKLEPEQQKEAWQKVVETAPEGKITARHVSKVVSQITKDNTIKEVEKKKKKAVAIPKEEMVDEDFKHAFDDFYREVQRARLDNWQTTSKKAASLLVKLIKDLIEVE